MKKIIGLVLGVLSTVAFASCDLSALMGGGQAGESTSQVVESVVTPETSEETGEHKHSLTRVSAREADCTKSGNITHWTCECGKYFTDAMGTKEVTADAVIVAQEPHTMTKVDGVEPTCTSQGRMEHWSCSDCSLLYADEEGTVVVSKSETSLSKIPHDLTHHAEIPVNGLESGVKEHWTCGICNNFFADAEGKRRVTEASLVLQSPMAIPDFVVNVPVGRDPVVLQLTDTQIIDSTQSNMSAEFYSPSQRAERCFDYIAEVVEATKPGLIIMTGDLVYGKFDHNGSSFLALVEFMDSLKTPWAPIFGNHDNESNMGVDWQCEQFENAEYCLFEQKELTGNGNYSVAIAQGGEIKRVFYMMDTNACGSASAASLANGHTKNNFVGFAQDQINWYTNQIETLKELVPDVKISFAYHIQNMAVTNAFNKYPSNKNDREWLVNLDTLAGKDESDFGYIGFVYGEWDQNGSVHAGLKALGVDSIFVGHEHNSSASIVVEGIRYQFGLKSSEYDALNWINANGEVIGEWISGNYNNLTPLVGGSVIVLSEESGVIEDAYNYYCTDKLGKIANGEVLWSTFMAATVNSEPKMLPQRKENE